jgi:hypothetical protein
VSVSFKVALVAAGILEDAGPAGGRVLVDATTAGFEGVAAGLAVFVFGVATGTGLLGGGAAATGTALWQALIETKAATPQRVRNVGLMNDVILSFSRMALYL